MRSSKINRILLVLFLVQVVVYFILFNSISLIVGLTINSIIILTCLKKGGYKITNPLFIGVIFFYITFNLPILYSAAINQIDATGVISFFFNTDELLFSRSIWLINITMMAFVIGTYNFKSNNLLKKKAGFKIKTVSTLEILLIVIWFLISGVIRVKYKLGAAGQEAEIAYVGVLQHLFYTGNVVLFSLYFLFGLHRKNKSKLFLILISGLILIVTQLILGWRGTAYSFFILCAFIYLIFDSPNKIKISKAFVIIVIALLPIATFVGNSFRSQTLTSSHSDYASSPLDFVEKVFFRQQGLTRLLVVLQNSNEDFLTNNFLITELYEKDISATRYIDKYFFGIPDGVKNSFGGSGPGCTYLMGGAVLSFFTFLVIGFVISYFYKQIFKSGKAVYIIIYANAIVMLRAVLAENFGLYFVKALFVTMLFSYFWFYVLNLSIGERK